MAGNGYPRRDVQATHLSKYIPREMAKINV